MYAEKSFSVLPSSSLTTIYFFLGGGPSRAVTTGGWQERLTKSWKNGTKEVAVATREEEVDLKDLVVEAATREEGV